VLSVATYRLAAETEHWLGRLDEAANRLGVRDGLVRATQVRDAQSSAGLAGKMVGLRRAFVADLLASSGRSPEDTASDTASDGADESDASRRIAPFLMAYDHGLRRVREGAPVDGRMPAEMSAITTGRPGHPVEELVRKEHGSHAALQERYGITLKAATNVTQRLCDLGILTRWESRSYRQVFLCQPVLDLLSLNFDS